MLEVYAVKVKPSLMGVQPSLLRKILLSTVVSSDSSWLT
jgi:hypothetical protein